MDPRIVLRLSEAERQAIYARSEQHGVAPSSYARDLVVTGLGMSTAFDVEAQAKILQDWCAASGTAPTLVRLVFDGITCEWFLLEDRRAYPLSAVERWLKSDVTLRVPYRRLKYLGQDRTGRQPEDVAAAMRIYLACRCVIVDCADQPLVTQVEQHALDALANRS